MFSKFRPVNVGFTRQGGANLEHTLHITNREKSRRLPTGQNPGLVLARLGIATENDYRAVIGSDILLWR